MKTVRKKILPCYFEDVKIRKKNFEIRKDEDDIQPDDNLILCEYTQEHYTGKDISRNVKYVLRNVPQFGLQDGYCIIGFKFRNLRKEKTYESSKSICCFNR